MQERTIEPPERPVLDVRGAPEPPATADVVVAGAGLTGVATALELARRGAGVVLVEARAVGAGTTGGTTGKLSLLQGSALGALRQRSGDRALRAYADAQREAQRWLRRELDDVAGALEERPAFTYATSQRGDALLRRELAACRAAGIAAERVDPRGIGLPFRVASALRLEEQAQLQPLVVLGALLDRALRAGATLVTGCRLLGASPEHDAVVVKTSRGVVRAARLVVATGYPVIDTRAFFARLEPSREFVAAYALDRVEEAPPGMYLSIDAPTRSIRTAPTADGGRQLVVGDGSYTPGRERTSAARIDELDAWTAERFPSARRTRWWAAQDYATPSRFPYAGPVRGSDARVFVATGYAKWGMTNAVASALAIAGGIRGRAPAWTAAYAKRRPSAGAAGAIAQRNATVAGDLLLGRISPGSPARPSSGPSGRIRRTGRGIVAESTVDGVSCTVSGVCTHLGGVLSWNEAERTWDCPLHASRFSREGRVIEGPALRDLERMD